MSITARWPSEMKGFANIDADTIMLQKFPKFEPLAIDEEAENQINFIKEVIVAVRNIRAESNIAPSKGLDLIARNFSADEVSILNANEVLFKSMAKLDSVKVLESNENAPLSVAKLVANGEILIPMAGFINKEAELARLAKEMEKLKGEVARIEGKLSNEAFVAKAPEQVIAKEREKMQEYLNGLAKLQTQYSEIEAL